MNEAANRAGLLLRSVFHQTREYQPRRSSVLQLPSMTDISTPGANSDCVTLEPTPGHLHIRLGTCKPYGQDP
jgi:hypothetical protein